MTTINAKIEGDPAPKARPRVTKNGVYTPKKTTNYEKKVRQAFELKAHELAIISCLPEAEAELDLSIEMVKEVPKTWPKWKKQAALENLIPMTQKPDLDNVEKTVKDALNRLIYVDDSQITSGTKSKVWGKRSYLNICVTIYWNRLIPKSKKELDQWQTLLGLL